MTGKANGSDSQRPRIVPGFRVGKLTAVERTAERKGGYVVWRCRCDCGGEILLDTRYLQRGTKTDCGCMNRLAPQIQDIAGQRYGRLVAIEPTADRKYQGSVVWRCTCDCGGEAFVPQRQLRCGYVKSCGCMGHPPLKDFIGRRFGRLQVIGYAGKADGKHMWRCRCECGSEVEVNQSNLQSGKTKSCGCLNREQIYERFGFVEGTSIRLLEYYQTHLSSRNTSGCNGVYQNKKTGKWHAQVSIEGKTKSLGAYSDKAKAIGARRCFDSQIARYLEQFYMDHPGWKRLVEE